MICQHHVVNRISAFDGLRGVAALVVVVHHTLLSVPALADVVAAADDGAGAAPPDLRWWERLLAYTPLHLVWDGPAAVHIFFVLSGFVLLPATRRTWRAWCGWYSGRLTRLYLPVWASLGIAVAVLALLPPGPVQGTSWWLDAHLRQDPQQAATGALMLFGTPGWINNPLWSIRLELVFTLVLPLAAGAVRWSRASSFRTVCAVVGLTSAIVVGTATDEQILRFLPDFGFGMLLATHHARLAGWAARADFRVRLIAIGTAIVLLSTSWTVHALSFAPAPVLLLTEVMKVSGAVLVVALVGCSPDRARLLEARPAQWLGSVSFSLYLTHDPVLTVLTFSFGGHPPLWLLLGTVIPTALIVAQVFALLVERPSHRLARRTGRGVGRLLEPVSA